MITSLKTQADYARFAAAAAQQIATVAQMQARLTLFGELPGSGWQFYVNAQEEACAVDDIPAGAIALRGQYATVMGAFDLEELGSFLSFLGVGTVTSAIKTSPVGYAWNNTLTVFTLAAGQRLPVPAFRGDFAGREADVALDRNPSVMAVLPLLWGDAEPEVQDQYYADSCTARNHGMAEFWLVQYAQQAIFTLAASAVVGQNAYLSAGETIEAYRGQGIGGHYIVRMANEYAAKGYTVCFVCEAPRRRFYQRLGFAESGVLYQHVLR